MKKLMIIICTLLLNIINTWAQPNLIFKVGASPGLKSLQQWIIINRNDPHNEFRFNLFQVKPQLYFGIGTHLQLQGSFFLEGGLTYTQKTSIYQIDFRMRSEGNPAKEYMSETEKSILLPVNIGVRLGQHIGVTSGLTAMKTISKTNELSNLNGFQQNENPIRFGWQMGVRYSVKRASIGVEYQGTLHRACQGMSVNNQSLELQNLPGNFVFGLQIGF